MNLGSFEVNVVSDGTFWLDGGAMFGVVPRVIWEKKLTPDGKNRVQLGLNTLLIRTDEKTILIDTGCGFKYSEKEKAIYGIGHETNLLVELEKLDVEPPQIDVVINTHLHFDHCGGNTLLERGQLRSAFPNAEFVIQSREFKDANEANERTRGSYFSQNWEVLKEEGRLNLIEGNQEIVPGVTCLVTPGHTMGHQSVKIESGGKSLLFLADLCPTSAHVPLPWVMAYDLYPLTTLETRRQVYAQAIRGEWIVCFEHEPRNPFGILFEEDGRTAVEPVNPS